MSVSRSWQSWQQALMAEMRSPVLSAASMSGAQSLSSVRATLYRILGPSENSASQTRAMVCTGRGRSH